MFHVSRLDPRAETAPDPSLDGAFAPCLQEIFPGPHPASGTGFALAQLGACDRPLLWVQERTAIREGGRPFPHGSAFGCDIIHVAASNAKNALWAMEEGLRCKALSAVIGELWGEPAALDFTATRRLAVASEKHGVPAFLLRIGGAPNLSGARQRWRIGPAPSPPHRWNPAAPGTAAFSAELFRSRTRAPASWTLHHDGAANRLDLAPEAGDRALGESQAG
ncbi:ImuA family protein [Novosphingopyxis iocasae]|uniref:ImuA family protein n=1 Tax=Novosphingopyxis iocasae TaxID=2762729 RepID=UPI00165125A0|nr:hypothetical protein [Novosphingopyxis iocasae]